ncbi:MAG: Aspartyl-tRNA synthetase [Candidatus Collierbacteria bacterium GW2011_GWB1_45_35]|uniref:Aspartate--tRNA(Asp/Asn) ligase n=1 Tax=Candidatus Collierbacteria bacterium GW2011_GWB2_45_17 TaxID=1618388 RepID=A0A837IJ73_9BACT|nr:MAG: Aspartyl-tRNA synthetase [Microgenomates group bacterium GW2011_GWC1_44_23]KKT95145.1 MAG: Aspartyl-tRNA synthetase [Candidatus Collierbacteria bacterium GW2011_GWA1_45_15]KKU00545.1 MAG: Aspartyl-tRNA synthetase [Candidatus Collierbacteria bacterium GW2011_GWB2_45_17]KKU04684.1 MAG: Aspartyl-tRNA synthetase [Candidatus Collierbacteria bacterium GW2011_GWB1_45_35]KKU07579.1 MAG: Aspartyl-tRNA synthetase [Candidatus Collierbacteria bacterium GW2011_GWC2_45_40]
MDRTYIKDLKENLGKQVNIKGFAETIRKQGGIIFLVLRDITGSIQTVVIKGNTENFEKIANLSLESVISITGDAKENSQAPGGIEVFIDTVEVLSAAQPELPIPVNEKGEGETNLDTRLDWRYLDLRKEENVLIFKVWTTLEQAFINYCIENNFIQIHSPKTVITSTESGSELFEINYFDQKAYLAQSPQFYKQMAMAAGLEKVFEIGPVFRANPSFTSRHDTEFTMYDIEMAYVESVHDLLAEEEKMMVAILTAIKEKHGEDIKKIFDQEVTIPTVPFPRISFIEAKKVLAELKVFNEKKDDLNPEEERAIAQYFKDKENHDFVFVYEYPASGRAFYSMRDEKDPTISKSFDLLYKGLEITSGAQREHRFDVLKKQIEEKGFDLKAFEGYLNFFKYGCPPHGGFAPGPSRFLMKILGLTNVREVTYVYRGVKRLTP